MKKIVSYILIGVIFLAGLSIMLYPTISNYVNQYTQNQVMTKYDGVVAKASKQDLDKHWEEAHSYNEELAQGNAPLGDAFGRDEAGTEVDSRYESILNLAGNGVMGTVEIPKIKVKLPIYHGTKEAVLQVGIGHLHGTSLPVGGTGTHAVISGHRGLPSAKLFTDLDQLKEGDMILLHVLDGVLAYQVDQIKVVLPTEIDDLEIDPDHDYLTLVTCTPYGVNSHRLLVRGVRTDYEQAEEDQSSSHVTDNSEYEIEINWVPYIITGTIAICLLLLIILYWKWRRYLKLKEERSKNNENQNRDRNDEE